MGILGLLGTFWDVPKMVGISPSDNGFHMFSCNGCITGYNVTSWNITETRMGYNIYIYLVGGFKHFLFCIIYGIILPIDFHIFQDG